MRKIAAYVLFVGVALGSATGCGADGTTTSAPATAPPSTTSASRTAAPSITPSAVAITPSVIASTAPSAEPTTSAPASPTTVRVGAKGPAVIELQQRLTELGYWNGKSDGSFGALTRQAVYAVQKAAGLGRDGVVGPKTQAALDQGVRPTARSTRGHVVEINLKRQLLMIVDDGQISHIFNTATGSNQTYVHDGNTYLADTPTGRFRVSRQIDGWRHGPLGPLWRPKYFNGGIAVHGAYSVPPYPASHGCARVSIAAMNWLWAHDELPRKTRVWVY
ncbi:MAG TPA: peptidoglycan-binding protein [Actinoplanes sp.]|nr:peptidoglycan-binding protein [Actinoplanes sp.]